MTRIKFCRDARILMSEHGEPDRFLDQENPMELLRFLRSAVEFEEGLTTAGLFRCLRPWGDMVGNMAWLDFAAWDRKASVSHVRDLTEIPDDKEGKLVEIVIYPSVDIRNGVLSTHWSNHALAEPYQTGIDRYFAFDLSPLEDWVSLPIRIEDTCEPTIVTRHSRKNWETTHLPPTKVYPTFFDTVILGFLDEISFHGSPQDTAEAKSGLLDLVEEAKIWVEDARTDELND